MGQARQRAQSDPTFGRIPKALKEQKRGIVISSPFQPMEGGGFYSNLLDPQELRYSLLLWDEIAWATNNIIHMDAGADEEFLTKAGIFQRPQVYIEELSDKTAPRLHIDAFNALNAQEPEKWSLALGETSLLTGDLPKGDAHSIALELSRAIPVPDVDVPLAEILEFKRRRQDEIQRLRAEIDNLTTEVMGAEDTEAALQAKKDHIEKACQDLLRVGMEWKFPVRISNLKCSFEVSGDQLAKAAAIVAGAEYAFGMPGLGALIGGAVSIFKVSGDVGRQPMRPRQSPYQYVYSFHNEVF